MTKVDKTKKIDRDKNKRLNTLILDGIAEIRGNEEQENTLKNLMERFKVFGGETRKVILNQELDNLSLSFKYMLLDSLFIIIRNEKYNVEPFYNNKTKILFLNNYPANTQIPYSRIFEMSKKFEEKYKKDLSEFNIHEIDNVLHELKPLTKSASHVNGRIIAVYIDWCINHNKTSVKENELRIKDMSYFNKFVDEEIELYLTKQDIDERLLKDCNNPQDAVIIRLLFSGVQGKNLAEIRNIKKEHVRQARNNDNVLTIYEDDGSRRKIKLEEETMKSLEEAMSQNEYYKRNGQVEDVSYGVQIELVDSDYVIRASKTRADEANRPVDKMVVYRRIQMIREVMGIKHLNAKNIVRSGIIYEASKRKELDKDTYMELCSIFNVENWYQVKKYCNPIIIKKLYNDSLITV